MTIVSCTKIFEIQYAHRLLRHEGKCKHLHGHSGRIEVTCSADELVDGMVIDFGVIKEKVGKWYATYWDHALIVELGDPLVAWLVDQPDKLEKVYVMREPPTAENLAKLAFKKALELLEEEIRTRWLVVEKVRFCETRTCWADCMRSGGDTHAGRV